jgi:anaerobic selenocysteine-containing dehydrogenase
MPEGLAEMSPVEAKRLGTEHNDLTRFVSRRDEIDGTVSVTEANDPRAALTSFHFMQVLVNVLTRPALDPICEIPQFKVCGPRVEKSCASGSLDRWQELEDS